MVADRCRALCEYVQQHSTMVIRAYAHISFIEENHSFKLSSKEQQNQQEMPPGTPSQNLMSYWGTFPMHAYTLVSLSDT